ncbi:MAG TPA: glycoside hydrolase family 3 N-terminal domain-containing protein [Candidatus Limnocylindrales bacterium]|nr:glycoside hydrolase family 3 N-terminal domain-containing protein [Candidatus Limnocylindrales bacterium]
MTPPPPARVRWATRAMAFGLVVFVLGLAVFAATRLAPGDVAATPAPSAATLASPMTTPAPDPTPTPEPTPTPTPPPTLEALVGQKLIVRMDGSAPGTGLLRRAELGEIGGVVLSGAQARSEEQVGAVARALQASARAGGQPPLLIMVAQEGGGIRAFEWAQPVRSATRMARMEADEIRSMGAAAGRALAAAGVNVNLAPVADVPGKGASFMRDTMRTWSADPERTARSVTAFAEGLASQDVLAAVKHFPGIGRVARSTDRFVETVEASRKALDRDLVPFRAAIDAGVPLVMLSNATYTALDPDNAAGWSRAIVQDLLRGELGFGGVAMTASLTGTARARKVDVETVAGDAVAAGVDMVVITTPEEGSEAVYRRLLQLAREGTLDRAALETSHARILALKATLAD